MVGFNTSHEARQNHTEIAQADETTNPRDAQNTPDCAVEKDRVWPVVRFTNGTTMLIVPTVFTVNNAEGAIEASREQVSRMPTVKDFQLNSLSRSLLFLRGP